jgi:hypothetical protein
MKLGNPKHAVRQDHPTRQIKGVIKRGDRKLVRKPGLAHHRRDFGGFLETSKNQEYRDRSRHGGVRKLQFGVDDPPRTELETHLSVARFEGIRCR